MGIAAEDHAAVLHDPLAQGVGRPVEHHDVDPVPGRGREVGESRSDPQPEIAVQGRATRGACGIRGRPRGQNGDVEVAVSARRAPRPRAEKEQYGDSGNVGDGFVDLALEILHEGIVAWLESAALVWIALVSHDQEPTEPERSRVMPLRSLDASGRPSRLRADRAGRGGCRNPLQRQTPADDRTAVRPERCAPFSANPSKPPARHCGPEAR